MPSSKSVKRLSRITSLCAALLACTDPRARPVPPQVVIQVAPNYQLKSPGQLVGSLYLYDINGLASLNMAVHTPDSAFVADSFVALNGNNSQTRPFRWTVPQGLAPGTLVTLRAKVVDFNNFASSDSLVFAVQ